MLNRNKINFDPLCLNFQCADRKTCHQILFRYDLFVIHEKKHVFLSAGANVLSSFVVKLTAAQFR